MPTLRKIVVAVAILVVLIQFYRPARTNPVSNPADAIAARLPVPAEASAILDRACRDCHSNETEWPWYSNVAPVSWFVIDHVDHARSHLNFSAWGTYDQPRQAKLLEGTCDVTRQGDMPLPSYLVMHGHARLTAADVEILCRWTEAARRR